MVALMLGLVVIMVMRVRRRMCAGARAAMIGVIGHGAVVLFQPMSSPLREFGYPTTDSYASFVFAPDCCRRC